MNVENIHHIASRAMEQSRNRRGSNDAVFHTYDFSPTCEKNNKTG